MVRLKLVKGEKYACPPAFGDRVVVRDESVDVDDKYAEELLADLWVDALGNEHNYFELADEVGEDGAAKAPAKRTRSKSKE